MFEAQGGKVVGTQNFSLNQQDFGSLVTRIKSAQPKPDVIMTGMFEPAFPAFVKQLRAAGDNTPVIGNAGIDTPSVLALGSAVEGVVYSVPAYAQPGGELAKFNDRIGKQFGDASVNNYAAVGYDLALIIKAALENAQSTDPAAVRGAIAGLKDFKGLTSPITYSYPGANGLPLRHMFLIRLKGGQRTLVKELSFNPQDVPKPF